MPVCAEALMCAHLEARKAREAAEQAYVVSCYRARYDLGSPNPFAYSDLLEATVACIVAKSELESAKETE